MGAVLAEKRGADGSRQGSGKPGTALGHQDRHVAFLVERRDLQFLATVLRDPDHTFTGVPSDARSRVSGQHERHRGLGDSCPGGDVVRSDAVVGGGRLFCHDANTY